MARHSDRPAGPPGPPHPQYVELHGVSAFSFLHGASLPEELIARAAELELPALALVDAGVVYGAPRFHQAARKAGVRALVGAEVALDPEELRELASGSLPALGRRQRRRAPRTGPLGLVPDPPPPLPSRSQPKDHGRPAIDRARGSLPALGPPQPPRESHPQVPRLTLLVENRAGYRNLCRLLTAAARGRPKGEARASFGLIAEHAAGLHCLTGGEEGPLAWALGGGGGPHQPTLGQARGSLPALRPLPPVLDVEAGRRVLERLGGLF